MLEEITGSLLISWTMPDVLEVLPPIPQNEEKGSYWATGICTWHSYMLTF